MSKALVSKLFVGGVVAVIAGLVFGFIAVWAAYASGVFVMNGPDVTGIDATPFAWAMVGVVLLGFIAILAGVAAGFVAWIGALLNTAALDDKAWFIVLLVLGLFSLGFFAMVAYVIAGPDSTRLVRAQPPAVAA
jgi:hypothetical protein